MKTRDIADPCLRRGYWDGRKYRPYLFCPDCGQSLCGVSAARATLLGWELLGDLPPDDGAEYAYHPETMGWIGNGRHPCQEDPWGSAGYYPGDRIVHAGRAIAVFARNKSIPVRRAADFGPISLMPVIAYHWEVL